MNAPIAWVALDGLAGSVLAWLATYALHSTALLAAAWLVGRGLAKHRVRLRELLWRFAVLAGIGTSLLQVGLDWTPYGGQWSLSPRPPAVAGVGTPAGARVDVPELAARQVDTAVSVGDPRPDVGHGSHEHSPRRRFDWVSFALAGWLWGGAAAVLTGCSVLRSLRKQLRRRSAARAPMVELLGDLCARAGRRRPVRLSVVEGLDVPISWGWLRPEICIPPRVETELGREEQRALLAHELAHVLRRDPAWMCLLRALEGFFFFQPLNRLARRELEECAEFQCDAWAVRQTGSQLPLARCLTQVAGWIVHQGGAQPAPAMARGRTRLVHRVQRLWDPQCRADAARALGLRWTLPSGALAILVFAFVAPGVSARAHVGPEPREAEWAPNREVVEVPLRTVAADALVSEPTLLGLDTELQLLEREYELLRAEALALGMQSRLAPISKLIHGLKAQRARLEALLPRGVNASGSITPLNPPTRKMP